MGKNAKYAHESRNRRLGGEKEQVDGDWMAICASPVFSRKWWSHTTNLFWQLCYDGKCNCCLNYVYQESFMKSTTCMYCTQRAGLWLCRRLRQQQHTHRLRASGVSLSSVCRCRDIHFKIPCTYTHTHTHTRNTNSTITDSGVCWWIR